MWASRTAEGALQGPGDERRPGRASRAETIWQCDRAQGTAASPAGISVAVGVVERCSLWAADVGKTSALKRGSRGGSGPGHWNEYGCVHVRERVASASSPRRECDRKDDRVMAQAAE